MENQEIEMDEDFDGVFRFTNNSEEEFKVLWNNKEYTFAPKSRSPMIIQGETLENIQAIRKKWAFKWAEKEWFKSSRYQDLMEMGRKAGGIFPTRDDKELEPYIQMCLSPLPISRAKIKEGKKEDLNISEHTAAVDDSDNLNEVFKEVTKAEKIRKLGPQSTVFKAQE